MRAIDAMNRPNTRVDDTILQDKMVLCCGEDTTELLLALPTADAPQAYHEYRCYKFWRFRHFTLAWSGIGTGCLEPLLYEILAEPNQRSIKQSPKIRQIILVGSAGAFSHSPSDLNLGEAYLINKAYVAATAIELPRSQMNSALSPALEPHLGKMKEPASKMEKKSVVSTDYYYGFSKDPGSDLLRNADARLSQAVSSAWGKVDMVDMETAQFYHFCGLLGGGSLSYAALRGPANYIDAFSNQTSNSLRVLRSVLTSAFRLLLLDQSTRVKHTLEDERKRHAGRTI